MQETQDTGSASALGRSPRVGSSTLLQYACLESSMGRGAWRAPWGHKEADMNEHTAYMHYNISRYS